MTADDLVDRLAARRAELGLTLRVLADRIGYDFNTLSGWETGYRQPRLQALCDWCEALGVEIEIRS